MWVIVELIGFGVFGLCLFCVWLFVYLLYSGVCRSGDEIVCSVYVLGWVECCLTCLFLYVLSFTGWLHFGIWVCFWF